MGLDRTSSKEFSEIPNNDNQIPLTPKQAHISASSNPHDATLQNSTESSQNIAKGILKTGSQDHNPASIEGHVTKSPPKEKKQEFKISVYGQIRADDNRAPTANKDSFDIKKMLITNTGRETKAEGGMFYRDPSRSSAKKLLEKNLLDENSDFKKQGWSLGTVKSSEISFEKLSSHVNITFDDVRDAVKQKVLEHPLTNNTIKQWTEDNIFSGSWPEKVEDNLLNILENLDTDQKAVTVDDVIQELKMRVFEKKTTDIEDENNQIVSKTDSDIPKNIKQGIENWIDELFQGNETQFVLQKLIEEGP